MWAKIKKKLRIKWLIAKWSSLIAQLNYRKCLFLGKVYFGPYMAARQGDVKRCYFMQKLVEHEIARGGFKKFRILEIGSWAGGSTITWAEAVKNSGCQGGIYCVDHWADYHSSPYAISKMFKKNKVFELFQHNISASGYQDMIFVLRGPSDKILPVLHHEQFDLIFIDGDHSYQGLSNDMCNSAPLLKEGGVLCGDDLELQYIDININHAKKNLSIDYMVDLRTRKPFHPGVSLAVSDFFKEQVSAWNGFWAMRKKENQWEKIKLKIDFNSVRIPGHLS